MNERIKQLAEQAEVTGYFAVGTKLATPIPLSPEMEKFAELIVRECLELCNKEHAGSIHTHAGAWNTAIKRCKESIETHFGIEE